MFGDAFNLFYFFSPLFSRQKSLKFRHFPVGICDGRKVISGASEKGSPTFLCRKMKIQIQLVKIVLRFGKVWRADSFIFIFFFAFHFARLSFRCCVGDFVCAILIPLIDWMFMHQRCYVIYACRSQRNISNSIFVSLFLRPFMPILMKSSSTRVC